MIIYSEVQRSFLPFILVPRLGVCLLQQFIVMKCTGFAYPATEERILELQTSEEFFTCDLSNPIRMYTSGLDKIPLESEGVRFFTSGSSDSCKNGLKLPVKVHPQVKNETLADGPTSPAAAPHFPGLSVALFVGLALFCVGM